MDSVKEKVVDDDEYSNQQHVWIFEPKLDRFHILSPQGIENIANHKYKSGEYTYLDNFLNPFWTTLTELLPMWLAPNMVTTLGGLHCAFSYLLLWYHSKNMNDVVPEWVVLIGAWCTFIYYTLDCMDGKQARRTGTSSPLGQLFDHGFDCVCILSHVSSTASYSLIAIGYDAKYYFVLQCSMQFAFFMAQWEEYYTHVLPHSAGKWLGVTEVNYGLALLTLSNAFIDREVFWQSKLESFLPVTVNIPYLKYLTSMQFNYAIVTVWGIMTIIMILGSFGRVYCHKDMTVKVFVSAVTKLISPFILALITLLLPGSVLASHTREISLTAGIIFCLITNKMIVFSMAKMSFASVQMDIIPYVVLCLWIRYNPNVVDLSYLVSGVTLWYLARLIFWCRLTIKQICTRLDIYCFSIKGKGDEEKKVK